MWEPSSVMIDRERWRLSYWRSPEMSSVRASDRNTDPVFLP